MNIAMENFPIVTFKGKMHITNNINNKISHFKYKIVRVFMYSGMTQS